MMAATILLLATFAVSCFGQAFPVVVAKAKRTNVTVPIAKTTLFTPAVDGTFRISVYMVTTVGNGNPNTAWQSTLAWSDDAGNWSDTAFVAVFTAKPQNSCCTLSNVTIEAKAGTPISYSVHSVGGETSGTTYEIFVTVEQLQ
jgi:hypothetical protein